MGNAPLSTWTGDKRRDVDLQGRGSWRHPETKKDILIKKTAKLQNINHKTQLK